MARFCSFQERTSQDVLAKLKKFSLSINDQDYILGRLISEGFIDEKRYVSAFVNDKFRLNKWGPVKISHVLKLKQISQEAIEEGFNEIAPEAWEETILELASKKGALLQHLPVVDRNQKLGRFLLQRGFTPEMVWKVVNTLD